jgi:hypothetical protein
MWPRTAAGQPGGYEAKLPPDYAFAEHLAAQMQMCALQDHREMWLEGYRKAGFDV